MEFLYHPKAGEDVIRIEGEVYNYLFKVRRQREGERIFLRNLEDGYLYEYCIDEVRKREATLTLIEKEHKETVPKKFFHLIWCIVDPKVIEKSLPMLNEIGVGKITFVYCERSQKNFRLKLDKLQKILINSNQQCGRSRLMEIEIAKDLDEVVQRYPDTVLIDFCKKKLQCSDTIQRALIGPEGGVTQEERGKFEDIRGLDGFILRSETAAIAVSAKVLL